MRLFTTCLAVVGMVAFAGCASPPLIEMQEARAAIAAARDFEADIYAPDQYDLAVMNLQLAEDAIADQDGVSPIGRSYDRALAFIDITLDEAERARLMAEDFKQQVYLRAQGTMPMAQAALDDAYDTLQRARGDFAFQEAQRLTAELDQMAASLNVALQLMEEGGFAEAADRFDSILDGARAIQVRAEFVMETAP